MFSQRIFLNFNNASSGRLKSTPLSNLCDDSVCNFNSLALFAIAFGLKKALSIIIFFDFEVTEQCSDPIIPAREIISLSSETTIFLSVNLYSFPSKAVKYSLFFANLTEISPLILSASYACIG